MAPSTSSGQAVVDLTDWSRSRKMTRPAVNCSELGRLLRDLRIGARLSEQDVARRAGVDVSFVSVLEHGRRGASRAVIRRLWLALGGEGDDLDAMLAAAGLLPESVVEAGGWPMYVRMWRGQVKVLERKLELRDACIIDQGRKLAQLLDVLP